MRTLNRKTSKGRWTRRILTWAVLVIGMQVLLKGCGPDREPSGERHVILQRAVSGMREEIGGTLADVFVPVVSFAGKNEHQTYWLLQGQIDSLFPFYRYLTAGMTKEADGGMRTLSLAEAADREVCETATYKKEEIQNDAAEMSLSELMKTENEATLHMLEQNSTLQLPVRGQQVQVDLEPLSRYETLVGQFYTIDANTMAGSDQLNVEKFLAQDMTVDKSGEGPQILIYHTHSQEAFADSVPGDQSMTIMGVGEYLTKILTEVYGYKVLHHNGQYDVKTRDDAYSAALPEVERILEENPSIEVVIDLHRDEMPEGTRLVTDVDGRPTARFMFFNGLSRTKKTGNISYLYNENQDANLAFSFQMQLKAMEYYPGLTRRIYLKGYRYNMHLCPKYLLVELGAQNNTLEEEMNACGPLAHILDLVLSGQ